VLSKKKKTTTTTTSQTGAKIADGKRRSQEYDAAEVEETEGTAKDNSVEEEMGIMKRKRGEQMVAQIMYHNTTK